MTDYETLRERHASGYLTAIGELMGHLRWTRDELEAAQTTSLRHLVASARAGSAWHRDRLTGIDVDALTATDMSALPVMTKDDLMASWDQVVTDPRLTLASAEQHLASIATDAYLLDEYHVVASGGSSGRRGVYVWGWDAWLAAFASTARWSVRYSFTHPETMVGPPVIAVVAASGATHMTSALPQTFKTPDVQTHRIPITLPLPEIVERLNEIQPTQLRGYASALAELAREQIAGRLHISPRTIAPDGEPLLPEMRTAAEHAWNVPVGSLYGTSEACTTAASCFMGDGMHLSEDLVIVEPVDAHRQPVAVGELSDKILLTNLSNPLLPLIRYEITDQVRVLPDPCPCGCAFTRIDDVQGRLDHVFRYGDVAIHPHVIRSPLSRRAEIVEYQVRQTPHGVEIDLRVDGACDVGAVTDEIAEHLREAGLRDPTVVVRIVPTIERTAAGKQRRFVPLG